MEREWTVCPQPDCEANGCANVLANKGETNLAEFKNMTTFHLFVYQSYVWGSKTNGELGTTGECPMS